MAPIDPWRNSTPDFGAVAFCTTNIEDFRTPLTSTSSTISSTYSLRRHKKRKAELSYATLRTKTQKWKGTKRGRWPSMEDNLWRKTTFDRRRPLTEDDFWWKTTFGEIWPLTEDELWWKTTFDGWQTLTEYNLRWKTTLIGCIVYYLKKMSTTPHLDSHSTTDPKPEILSSV